MKAVTLSVLLLLVSLLFLNVWQSYRYEESLRVLRVMEQEQQEWVEKTRRIMAAEALLASPDRLDQLAQDELGMEQAQPEDMLHIQLPGEDR